MGNFVYEGIDFRSIGHHTYEIFIEGVPIDLKKEYKLAIPDMFTFGRFFPEINRSQKNYFLPEFLRDLLKVKLMNLGN